MSGHNYSYFCGCAQCCAQEEADERDEAIEQAREDAIAARTNALVAERLVDEEVMADSLCFASDDATGSILTAAGRFLARYSAAGDDFKAEHAEALFRALLPHAEAYVREVAESDATDEYDRPRESLLDKAAQKRKAA